MASDVLAVVGMKREAGILAGRGACVAIAGSRGRLLRHNEALSTYRFNGLISIGICGALDEGLNVGTCVIASAVIHDGRQLATDEHWTKRLSERLPEAIMGLIAGTDFILLDPGQKRALNKRTRAIVADMESHVAADYAAAHRLPFAALRVVSDDASHALPPAVLKAMKPDGGIDVPAVIGSLLRNPFQIPALIRTTRDSEFAFKVLLRCLDRLGPRLMGPDLG